MDGTAVWDLEERRRGLIHKTEADPQTEKKLWLPEGEDGAEGRNQEFRVDRHTGLVAESCPTLATSWTAARQAPLSLGFSRQEYWLGVPLPSPGEIDNTIT